MKKHTYFLYYLCILSHHMHANDSATFHRYLWANYNHFSGNLTCAQDWYKKIFSADSSLYTYKGYLSFLFDTQQFKKIVDLIPSLEKKFEQDCEVQLLFALALEKNNQPREAEDKLVRLNATFKTNSEITFRVTQIFMRRKEPENALLAIDGFLNNTPRRPNNFVFYFYKSQIYVQLNKLPDALASIQKCLEIHPRFDKGWLLLATLHEQEGKIKEAIAGYGTFLEINGANNQIEKHLFNLMAAYKRAEEHKHLLTFSKSPLETARMLYQQKKYDTALALINKHLEINKNDEASNVLKIDLLVAMRKFDTIAETITLLFNNNPDNPLWLKTIHLLSFDGMPYISIITTLDTLAKDHPTNAWPYLYSADLHMRNNNITPAINSLERALPLITDNSLRTKILYQLGLLNHGKENYSND